MKQTLTVDSEILRQAMRAWTPGVTIVTASHEGEQHGMTVSSFTSIALEPPIVIISLQTDSRTHELVSQAKAFAVTILSDKQQELSDRFAGRIPDAEDRSLMNVTFVMAPDFAEMEKEFLEFATGKGMIGIKGHRSVGGFRASIYNAMPIESVQALVDAMQEFEKTK